MKKTRRGKGKMCLGSLKIENQIKVNSVEPSPNISYLSNKEVPMDQGN